MKYFSELTHKYYESEKECIKAEAEFKQNQEKEKREEEKKLSESSRRKKQLSDNIESATKRVDEANSLYEIAKQEAQKILEESNNKVSKILEDAEKAVRKAESEKFTAILAFNKEFGAYKTVYTGDSAIKEYNKSLSRFDRTFNDFLKLFFE